MGLLLSLPRGARRFRGSDCPLRPAANESGTLPSPRTSCAAPPASIPEPNSPAKRPDLTVGAFSTANSHNSCAGLGGLIVRYQKCGRCGADSGLRCFFLKEHLFNFVVDAPQPLLCPAARSLKCATFASNCRQRSSVARSCNESLCTSSMACVLSFLAISAGETMMRPESSTTMLASVDFSAWAQTGLPRPTCWEHAYSFETHPRPTTRNDRLSLSRCIHHPHVRTERTGCDLVGHDRVGRFAV